MRMGHHGCSLSGASACVLLFHCTRRRPPVRCFPLAGKPTLSGRENRDVVEETAPDDLRGHRVALLVYEVPAIFPAAARLRSGERNAVTVRIRTEWLPWP